MDELLQFMTTNFWVIFLIAAMLSTKAYRMCGLILLAIQTIFGFIQWAYLLIVILALMGAILNDTKKK